MRFIRFSCNIHYKIFLDPSSLLRPGFTATRLPPEALQDDYAVVGHQTARAYSAPFSSFTSKTRSL